MVQILLSSRFVPQDGGLSNHGSHHIWVHVRSGPSVLEVPFSLFLSVPPDPNRCPTICDTLYEKLKHKDQMLAHIKCIKLLTLVNCLCDMMYVPIGKC
ncbi:hypothetical protein Hanom_Chr14g01288141 [Helianthus anomalus]